ncbi:MAG: hypothetical protein MSS85_11400 [Pyramidobacter sp.]|nr:hypothetical protein [Pyramidobacter sp.]
MGRAGEWPPCLRGEDGGRIGAQLDALCLILEATALLRDLSDEPREITNLIKDASGDGRLEAPENADFLTALRELVSVAQDFLTCHAALT